MSAPTQLQQFWMVIFGLHAVTLFTTMAGMELTSWLLFLVGVGGLFQHRRRSELMRLFRTPYVLCLAFFLGWGALSIFSGPDVGSGNIDYFGKYRWILLFVIFTLYLSPWVTESRSQLLRYFAPLFVLVGVYAVFQTLTGVDIARSHNDYLKPMGTQYYRAIGFFNIPLTFAYSFGMLGFLFGGWLSSKNKSLHKKWRLVCWLAIFFWLLGLMSSGVRGSWVAAFITLPLAATFYGRKVFWRTLVILALFAGTLMVAVTPVRTRVASIVDINEHSNWGRVKIWRATWEIFKDHPLKGVGLGRNRAMIGDYYDKLNIENGQRGHAHNNYLQFLVGTGVVGFLIWLSLCALFLLMAWRLYHGIPESSPGLKGLAFGAFISQIYMHIGGLTEVNFTDGEVNHVIVVVWALVAALSLQFNQKEVQVT